MLHFCHIISIKVVVSVKKCTMYSIFYNTWLNRRCFSCKVSLPFVYRRLLMLDTKSHDYSNLSWLSGCGYSRLFLFSTRPSPTLNGLLLTPRNRGIHEGYALFHSQIFHLLGNRWINSGTINTQCPSLNLPGKTYRI